MSTINVTLNNGRCLELPEGTPVGALAPDPDVPELPYVAAMVNNDLSSLSYPCTVDSSVRFLTMADPHGWRVYRNSLCFLLARAVREAVPDAIFSLEHSFGSGLYCSFARAGSSNGVESEDLEAIEKRMREIIDEDAPIERRKISYCDAVTALRDAGQDDKLHLLWHRNPPRIVMHRCGGFSDLAHGPLVPSTGALTRFALVHYPPGFVLHLPDRENPRQLAVFEDQPHLFRIFREHKDWGRTIGVRTAGRLNQKIADRQIEEFIWACEARQEKKLGELADRIASAPGIQLVLIAGPSCSGKTTFAKRLATHLMVNGLSPIAMGTDDYFVGADRNPVDADGNPDFEHIEAVDLELFNDHLARLIAGEEIQRPAFNFERKEREPKGRPMRLLAGQILLVEGIHGLNPLLTQIVPADQKFRIYVSALTQLGIDANNRISTTDNRLIRRLVRDHRYRGHSALFTLQLWPSVRHGEKRWIFPFQREADAAFNSALDYELAVLKPLVEPLLQQVKPDCPEYAESRRLTEFLLNFLAAPDRAVPRTSILREYIGGSNLHY